MSRSVFSSAYEYFKNNLVQARKAAGLTQMEVAARLNRPQSYVSKYECGERRLDVIEFLEVADALGIDELGFIRKLREIQREGKYNDD